MFLSLPDEVSATLSFIGRVVHPAWAAASDNYNLDAIRTVWKSSRRDHLQGWIPLILCIMPEKGGDLPNILQNTNLRLVRCPTWTRKRRTNPSQTSVFHNFWFPRVPSAPSGRCSTARERPTYQSTYICWTSLEDKRI